MEIKLSQETFKALANTTRIAILKHLDKRRYTQSELADLFGFAVTTIKQHIDDLKKTGLVNVIDDGRKWKYVELTKEGKAILHPEEKKIWILLGTFAVSIAGGVYALSKRLLTGSDNFIKDDSLLRAPIQKAEIMPQLANTIEETAVKTFSQTPDVLRETTKTAVNSPDILFYIFLIIALISIFGLIFYLIRRKKRLRWLNEVILKHKK